MTSQRPVYRTTPFGYAISALNMAAAPPRVAELVSAVTGVKETVS